MGSNSSRCTFNPANLTERRKTKITQLAFLKKINRQKIGQQINQTKTDDLPAVGEISTKATARLDQSPNERVPIVPYLFSLLGAEVCDELRWRREVARHDAAELVILEDRPTRVPAHGARPDCIDDAVNSGFADGERTHRARLDVRIEHAVSEPKASGDGLRLGECDQFRVTADVAIPDDAIVAMGDYFAALGDERREGSPPLGASFESSMQRAIITRSIELGGVAPFANTFATG